MTSDFLVIIYHYNLDIFFILKEKDKKEDDANEFVSAVCWRTVSAFLEMYEKKTKLTAAFVSVSNFAYCSVCIFGRQ